MQPYRIECVRACVCVLVLVSANTVVVVNVARPAILARATNNKLRYTPVIWWYICCSHFPIRDALNGPVANDRDNERASEPPNERRSESKPFPMKLFAKFLCTTPLNSPNKRKKSFFFSATTRKARCWSLNFFNGSRIGWLHHYFFFLLEYILISCGKSTGSFLSCMETEGRWRARTLSNREEEMSVNAIPSCIDGRHTSFVWCARTCVYVRCDAVCICVLYSVYINHHHIPYM